MSDLGAAQGFTKRPVASTLAPQNMIDGRDESVN